MRTEELAQVYRMRHIQEEKDPIGVDMASKYYRNKLKKIILAMFEIEYGKLLKQKENIITVKNTPEIAGLLRVMEECILKLVV
jgi:hypothetical protein